MRWWRSSVCMSVCPVPDPESRTEGRSERAQFWQEESPYGWPMTPFRGRKVNHLQVAGEDNFGAAQPVFYRDVNVWWTPARKFWVAVQVTASRGGDICGGSITTGRTALLSICCCYPRTWLLTSIPLIFYHFDVHRPALDSLQQSRPMNSSRLHAVQNSK